MMRLYPMIMMKIASAFPSGVKGTVSPDPGLVRVVMAQSTLCGLEVNPFSGTYTRYMPAPVMKLRTVMVERNTTILDFD